MLEDDNDVMMMTTVIMVIQYRIKNIKTRIKSKDYCKADS